MRILWELLVLISTNFDLRLWLSVQLNEISHKPISPLTALAIVGIFTISNQILEFVLLSIFRISPRTIILAPRISTFLFGRACLAFANQRDLLESVLLLLVPSNLTTQFNMYCFKLTSNILYCFKLNSNATKSKSLELSRFCIRFLASRSRHFRHSINDASDLGQRIGRFLL